MSKQQSEKWPQTSDILPDIVKTVRLSCSCSEAVAVRAVHETLDVVAQSLDRVVMPRDVFMEICLRLKELRPR